MKNPDSVKSCIPHFEWGCAWLLATFLASCGGGGGGGNPPTLATPSLVDAEPQIYTVGVAITNLDFTNTGGRSLIGCSVDRSLPSGLTIERSSGNGTCRLTGIPTAESAQTTYTITATNASGMDRATVVITVNPSVPGLANPSLADAEAQIYTVGVAITNLEFTNTGGGSLTACSVDRTLPSGLTVEFSLGNGTCRLTGIPTAESAQTTYTITATNASGMDDATVVVTVNSVAPDLDNRDAQVYTADMAITDLAFTNNGGGQLMSCASKTGTPDLPADLIVRVSTDESTCVIAGTPTAYTPQNTYTITATNATGMDDATVVVTVNPAAPILESPEAPDPYTVGETITDLPFTNSGGGQLTDCEIKTGTDELPDDLNVIVSSNKSTCVITGTPTTYTPQNTYTVTATNVTGMDDATVVVTVNPPAPILGAPDTIPPSYPTGVPIIDLEFRNTGGGILTNCAIKTGTSALPDGLTVSVSTDESICVITGTPLTATPVAEYTITATNDGGMDDATVMITIVDGTPSFDDPGSITFTTDVVKTQSFSNTNSDGGSITGCSLRAPQEFPNGLSISADNANNACVLTGSVADPSVAQNYTIDVTNDNGTSTLILNITVNPPQPILVAPEDPDFYNVGKRIAPLRITNSGGDLTGCSAPELVMDTGLSIGLDPVVSGCIITGTPTATTNGAISYTITATNDGGESMTMVSIEVRVSLPRLEALDLTDPAFVVGTDIGREIFANLNKINLLTSCDALDDLPDDLTLEVTSDMTTCEITGIPTTYTPRNIYTITATNEGGTQTTTVAIIVNPRLPDLINPTAQSYPARVELMITITNMGGGELETCVADGNPRDPALPSGLSVRPSSNGSDCEIIGTPSMQTETNTYIITATNATGRDRALVVITIDPPLPSLTDIPNRFFGVGRNVSISFVNSGGGDLTDCSTASDLPLGLTIERTSNMDSCMVTGTTFAASAPTTHIVTATHATGSGTGNITLTVGDIFIPDEVSVTVPTASLSWTTLPHPYSYDIWRARVADDLALSRIGTNVATSPFTDTNNVIANTNYYYLIAECFDLGGNRQCADPSDSGPRAVASLADDVAIDGPRGITTTTIGDSTYALVAAFDGDRIQIIDVSDPTDPTIVGTVTDTDPLQPGQTSLELHGAAGITTTTIGDRTYALVAASQDNGMQIIDITDPTVPTPVYSISDTMELVLGNAYGITTTTITDSTTGVVKTYALVAAFADGGLQLFDITDPVNTMPAGSQRHIGMGANPTALLGARAVATTTTTTSGAVKTYALVAAEIDDSVQIIDITDPADPDPVTFLGHTEGTELGDAYDIVVTAIGDETFALVASEEANNFQVLDVSNPDRPRSEPERPRSVGFVNDNLERALSDARGVAAANIGNKTYAIVASPGDDGVQIIDVSVPGTPREVGALTDTEQTILGGADSVAIATIGGRTYALVTAYSENGIQIIDITTPQQDNPPSP